VRISNKKELSPEQREKLLSALKARFEKHMKRHEGLEWAEVQAKLEAIVVDRIRLGVYIHSL
jgi:uncharacterized protein DUF4256